MGHALANDFAPAMGNEELKSLNVAAAGKLLALAVHPEDAEGERGIDGGLGLVAIHAEDGKRRLAVAEHSPCVYRAQRMFQVRRLLIDSILSPGNSRSSRRTSSFWYTRAGGAQCGSAALAGGRR